MTETKAAKQQASEAAAASAAGKQEPASAADGSTTTTNKRKRGAPDQEEATGEGNAGTKRTSPTKKSTANEEEGQNAAASQLDFESLASHQSGEQAAQANGETASTDASSTAAAALAGIYPTMTVPQPTDLSFAAGAGDGDRSNLDPSFNMDTDGDQSFNMDSINGQSTGGASGQKPQVGSEEWHRVRRDNHKEVERRRRETINEGINELAKIVPGCEKNKGSILQRAVAFITQLKENESQNIEKWTLEKLLTEQAIAELSGSVDKLKNECERAWREAETWKKTCQSAGLDASESVDEKAAPAANADGAASTAAS